MADNPFDQFIAKDKSDTSTPAPKAEATEKDTPQVNPFDQYIPKEQSFVDTLPKELFEHPHPTAQLMIGAMKPFAGAAEWAGVTKPAEVLNRLSQRFEEGPSGTTAKALDIAGQIAPLTMGAEAVKLPEAIGALTKASPLARYSLSGGAQGALTPTTTQETKDQGYGDLLSDKIAEITKGAGTGAILGKGSQVLLNPKVSSTIQNLAERGIKLTPGQLLSQIPLVGSSIRNLEHGVANLPLVGGPVQSAIGESYKDFNKSVGNEILSNIGEELPKYVEAGHDMIKHIQDKISTAYDHVAQNARLSEHFDPNEYTSDRIGNALKDAVADLTPDAQREVNRFVRTNVIDHIANTVDMTGKQFRAMEKALGDESFKAYKAGDNLIGEAYGKVQDDLRKELGFQNEAIADKLKQTHDLFKAFIPVEKAAAKHTNEGGVFAPQTLKTEVEREAGKAKAAAGLAPMSDLTEKAVSVLGKNMPGGERSMGNTLEAAALIFDPIKTIARALGGSLATGALYNRPMLKLADMMARYRPEVMRQAQPAISDTASRLGAAVAASPDNQ